MTRSSVKLSLTEISLYRTSFHLDSIITSSSIRRNADIRKISLRLLDGFYLYILDNYIIIRKYYGTVLCMNDVNLCFLVLDKNRYCF